MSVYIQWIILKAPLAFRAILIVEKSLLMRLWYDRIGLSGLPMEMKFNLDGLCKN